MPWARKKRAATPYTRCIPACRRRSINWAPASGRSSRSPPNPRSRSTTAGRNAGGTLFMIVEQAAVQLGGEYVDLPGQLGVGLELHFLRVEVVVGLGLLERGLAVLPNRDEGGQEDGFERHDQGQLRPRIGLDEEHPDPEEYDVDIDERHRSGVRGDRVGDSQLNAGGPLLLMGHDGRVVGMVVR